MNIYVYILIHTIQVTLRRLEGLRVAASGGELFVDGQAFPLSADARDADRDAARLLHSNQLSCALLTSELGPPSDHLKWYVRPLVGCVAICFFRFKYMYHINAALNFIVYE